MNSAIYFGRVRHRRHEPRRHAFTMGLYLVYLDLDELPRVFHGRWLWSARRPAPVWFRRADYLGDPAVPLDEAVRAKAHELTGTRPEGPVRVLTHLRTFGLCFNPVTFYYCFDSSGTRVETVLAEITNTPWNERHVYAVGREEGARAGAPLHARFAKEFHVSPFLPMDDGYDWRFTEPGRTLVVHMENLREGRRAFDATLTLERREITRRSLAAALLRHPLVTGKVVLGIYAHALALWLKRVPVFDHPAKRALRRTA